LNQPPASAAPSYAVLSGGIGGAKLVLGLQQVLAATQLQVIANTGDDFEHLGLPICPDIDTLIYTLAGVANPETGWGLRNESWQFMAALEALGGATWFRLGDRDLATHVRRRDLLQRGQTLSEATTALRLAQNVSVPIWPMSDAPVRTLIETAGGPLEFQDYFVRQQAQPVALGFYYSGSESARASSGALRALNATDLAAIILTPSNPWLSIAPILSVDDIKATITANAAPVIAVSPIVNGAAIKGPTAKLMRELGIEPSVNSIAMHYRDILDGLVIDTQDRARQDAIEAMGIRVYVTNTVMQNLADKAALAQHVLDFAAQLRADRL
jgi:LPPG:FO 2-phospho-L-lactate transferase